jgi:hypothetical protein
MEPESVPIPENKRWSRLKDSQLDHEDVGSSAEQISRVLRVSHRTSSRPVHSRFWSAAIHTVSPVFEFMSVRRINARELHARTAA